MWGHLSSSLPWDSLRILSFRQSDTIWKKSRTWGKKSKMYLSHPKETSIRLLKKAVQIIASVLRLPDWTEFSYALTPVTHLVLGWVVEVRSSKKTLSVWKKIDHAFMHMLIYQRRNINLLTAVLLITFGLDAWPVLQNLGSSSGQMCQSWALS